MVMPIANSPGLLTNSAEMARGLESEISVY